MGLVRNFFALLLTHLLGRGIRFLYLIVIAHLLTPEEVGVFVYGVALYLSFFGLSQFGQQGVLSTRIGRGRRGIGVLISHSLMLRLVTTGIVAALLLVYVLATETDPLIRLAMIFFVLTLIPRSIVFWVRQCYVALERTTWIPRWEAGFRSSEVVLGTAALWLGGGLLAICFIHLLFWTIEMAAALQRLAHQEGVSLRPSRDLRLLKRLGQVSVFFMFSYWLADSFQMVAVVIVKELQPDTALVGFLGLAMQLLSTLMVFFVALGDAMVPRLSRAYGRHGSPGLEVVPLLMRVVMFGGGLVAILAADYAPPLIEWVLGKRYGQVGPLFALLCWALGPFAVVLLSIQSLNAMGRWRDGAAVAVLAVLVQLGLLLTWAADGEVLRAAWSIVIAALVGAALGIALLGGRIYPAGAGQSFLTLGFLVAAFLLAVLRPFHIPWEGELLAAAYVLINLLSRAITVGDLTTLATRLRSQKPHPTAP